jgi:hypothetical protein
MEKSVFYRYGVFVLSIEEGPTETLLEDYANQTTKSAFGILPVAFGIGLVLSSATSWPPPSDCVEGDLKGIPNLTVGFMKDNFSSTGVRRIAGGGKRQKRAVK